MGLVAPSGTGKTLLLRNLALLDPLQQGQITLAGKSPHRRALPAYRACVSYLPQQATAFEGTVGENLERVFAMEAHRQRRFDRAKIETWLDKLGRGPDFLALPAPRLSGGETQLLALLRVLQLDPQVLLLDEPTASLDFESALKVEALLAAWLQQPGRACLLTSHDRQQIQRLTNRQLQLGDFAE